MSPRLPANCSTGAQSNSKRANTPPRRSWAGVAGSGSVAALGGTAPDQAVGIAVLVGEEVGVDGTGEARIVQLEAQVVAALVGGLAPGGADFGLMRCTA